MVLLQRHQVLEWVLADLGGDLGVERKKPLTENDEVDGIVGKVEKIGDDAKEVRTYTPSPSVRPSPSRHLSPFQARNPFESVRSVYGYGVECPRARGW